MDLGLQKFAKGLLACDWSKSRFPQSLFRIPAIFLCVVFGLIVHDAAGGIISVSGAFSCGLVGSRKVCKSSLKAMLLTISLMGFGAFLGTITGNLPLLSITVTSLLSGAFALCVIYDEDLGWITMQGLIALLVSTSFPGTWESGLLRCGLVVGGGVLQLLFILIFDAIMEFYSPLSDDLFESEPPATKKPVPAPTPPEKINSFKLLILKHWTYPLRVIVTTVIAVELGKHLGIRNSYWLPMTMIIILKPDFYRTYSGGFQRVIGTFIGVLFASAITHLLQPGLAWLIGLTVLFSTGAIALVKVNPVPFSACLTAYVVFLIAISGLPEASITWARLELTAIGSSLAIASRMIGFHALLATTKKVEGEVLKKVAG